jgi:hypothetical protein
MAGKRWERFVEREYIDADNDFLETVLPIGEVDGSSFGLISDATEYVIVKINDEKHIKPQVSSLDSILKSLKSGGKNVNKKDALESVDKFAQIWEEKIRSADKWDEMIEMAEEEEQIKEKAEIKEEKGFLGRISKLFGKK